MTRWAPKAASVLAALCLGLVATDLLLAAIAPLETAVAPGVTRSADQQVIDADISLLREVDIFGGEAAVVSALPQEEDLPETTLQLTLIGPAAGLGGGAEGSALIELPNRKQVRVKVGEEIMPGVALRDVQRTRVVISRAGVSETLSLPNRPDPLPEAPPPTEEAPAPASEGPVLALDDLGDYDALLWPMLQQSGFQRTDKILSIDGQPLPASEDEQATAFAELMAASSVEVTFERQGQLITRTVTTPGVVER